ncbi:MAG: LuxR family transcriptional regulator [Chlorobium sp.]|jgi:DNA-binding CsgD family transcriptional regulator|uniref:helix-turn-helix transcriptional regulator n=1 Tax=Chlorobium sp. TaxID=1095 RepID=UPI0025BD54AD|nr:LuxR family transcriptional regulator [Chlorobium sp.]MCF8216913.1 LuxR family transcriptional regulator [Chlorobium sp.]MCF8271761.1 LuxR family transcriptional regulator [Chlorobium sp.]MCF8288130.1 LuxR family transcriptional regulator [Chlorobium sp.]MCF8291740.1 LuxR family transcriptional regulator [Chlorobium sp.]MCF8385813.1 LuxR family transcriptional regulator [Chlorobium sp.]
MKQHAQETSLHCPVCGLPITRRPHWHTYHAEADYSVPFEAIGSDIVHIQVVTDHDTYLDHIDNQMFLTVCNDLGITGKTVYVVINLNHIRNIRFSYKKDFANLIYNWGPIFSVLVLYNAHPDILTTLECFASICPINSRLLITDTYQDAICHIMSIRSSEDHQTQPQEEPRNSFDGIKRSFLTALARISWLDMHDLPVPATCGEFSPFFLALEEFRKDIQAKKQLHQQNCNQEKIHGEQQLEHNRIQLNAKIDLYMKNGLQFGHDIQSMENIISAKEAELAEITALAEHDGLQLSRLYEQIESLSIEPAMKTKLLEECGSLIETGTAAKQFRMELTEADWQFLRVLQNNHPSLSEKERRLCLLIKLNYNTKDIARETGVSLRGMETIRYRLHKKIGLQKHQSMKQYFALLQTTS